MGTTQLLTDIKLNEESLGQATSIPPDIALAFRNVWAFMESMVGEFKVIDDRLVDHATVLEELIEQNENVLHPEFAGRIVGVFEIGKLLCNELAALVDASDLDDLAKRRLEGLLQTFRKTATEVTVEISEVTVDMDELLEGVEDDEDDPVDEAADAAPSTEDGDEPDHVDEVADDSVTPTPRVKED